MYLWAAAATTSLLWTSSFHQLERNKKVAVSPSVSFFMSDIYKVAPPVVKKDVNCGIVYLCMLKLDFHLDVSTIYHLIVGHGWKPLF